MQEAASILKIFLPCKIYRRCWRIVKRFQPSKVANMSLYIQLSFVQTYLHCMFHFTVIMVQCAVFIQIPHHNEYTLFPAPLYPAPCTSFWCAKMIHILIPSLWVNYFWDSSESWAKVNPDIFPTISCKTPPPWQQQNEAGNSYN